MLTLSEYLKLEKVGRVINWYSNDPHSEFKMLACHYISDTVLLNELAEYFYNCSIERSHASYEGFLGTN